MLKRYEQACPIARTLDLVGDRWTLLILRDMFMGQTRFNEILANSPGMTPKVLSQRLKFLADNGFVAREVQGEFPPRSQYVLTERGRTLFPILKTIGEWGVEHMYEGEDKLRDEVLAGIRSIAPAFTDEAPEPAKAPRKSAQRTARTTAPRRGGSRTARTTPRKRTT